MLVSKQKTYQQNSLGKKLNNHGFRRANTFDIKHGVTMLSIGPRCILNI